MYSRELLSLLSWTVSIPSCPLLQEAMQKSLKRVTGIMRSQYLICRMCGNARDQWRIIFQWHVKLNIGGTKMGQIHSFSCMSLHFIGIEKHALSYSIIWIVLTSHINRVLYRYKIICCWFWLRCIVKVFINHVTFELVTSYVIQEPVAWSTWVFEQWLEEIVWIYQVETEGKGIPSRGNSICKSTDVWRS